MCACVAGEPKSKTNERPTELLHATNNRQRLETQPTSEQRQWRQWDSGIALCLRRADAHPDPDEESEPGDPFGALQAGLEVRALEELHVVGLALQHLAMDGLLRHADNDRHLHQQRHQEHVPGTGVAAAHRAPSADGSRQAAHSPPKAPPPSIATHTHTQRQRGRGDREERGRGRQRKREKERGRRERERERERARETHGYGRPERPQTFEARSESRCSLSADADSGVRYLRRTDIDGIPRRTTARDRGTID